MQSESKDLTIKTIAVYIVTYRRHEMLKRAIRSVVFQTYKKIDIYVVNDDPEDYNVEKIIRGFADSRISIYQPIEKRGAVRNFNIMFGDKKSDFVALLEDDNWWEPGFLEAMLNTFERFPHVDAVCGNELIWDENIDGSWTNTGVSIWPNFGELEYKFSLESICGSAVICNSSTVYRLNAGSNFLTLDNLIVDVTEHFRERTLSGLALNSRTLVNYSQTLLTARTSGVGWGQYQIILIGSVFAALETSSARNDLAAKLWYGCSSKISPRAVTLVMCSLSIPEARSLLAIAPLVAILRTMLAAVRHPYKFLILFNARAHLNSQFIFLKEAPLTQHLARG